MVHVEVPFEVESLSIIGTDEEDTSKVATPSLPLELRSHINSKKGTRHKTQ